MIARLFLVILAAALVPTAQAACVAESGRQTAALVELYTADGCTSCLPADRWLAQLESRFPPDALIPLALHVDLRDYLGSRDPQAERRFAQRERRLLLLQRMALVYTPRVFLQGGDFQPWASNAFDEAVRGINARPARAHLKVEIRTAGPSGLDAVVQVDLLDAAQRADAGLYVAAFQRRPKSEATSGEDEGRRHAHAHVVLEWQGPFSASPEGRFAIERTLPLVPGATPGRSGVAAFVQDRRTAEVLQAVLLAACSP